VREPQRAITASGEVLNLCPQCEMYVKGELDIHMERYCPLRNGNPVGPNVLLPLVRPSKRAAK
jgi:hypothetical protein